MTYLYLENGSCFDVQYGLIAGLLFGFFMLMRLYLVCRDSFGKPKE